MIITSTQSAVRLTTSGTSQTLSSTLDAPKLYSVFCEADTWVRQGVGAQTAQADTDANVFVPAGGTIYLSGKNGDNVAVIQDSAAGQAVIALVSES